MDKTLALMLFPFFTVVLLIALVALLARGGKPVSFKLRGLGVHFELTNTGKEHRDEAD